jgi:hypothetical protein
MAPELQAIRRAVKAAQRKGWMIVLDGSSNEGCILAMTTDRYKEACENGVSIREVGEEIVDANESCGMAECSADALYIPMTSNPPSRRQTLVNRIAELEALVVSMGGKL